METSIGNFFFFFETVSNRAQASLKFLIPYFHLSSTGITSMDKFSCLSLDKIVF